VPPPAEAALGTGERIGVIDLGGGEESERQAQRARVESGLAGKRGVRPVDDAGLRQALIGESSDPQLVEGRRALAGAQTAFGALDCARARGDADRAVLALAIAQAAGAPVADELRRAHTIRLVCADQGGDRGAAQSAAAALRRLKAGDPPQGVGDAIWSRYPALDATTGVQIGRLAITSQPAGAAIWIDHAPAGKAPITTSLPEGEHLVAAALPSRGAVARRVTVAPSWKPAPLALALPAGGGSRWYEVESRVRAWRRGTQRPDPAGIGRLLARAGLSHAVLIDPRGKLQVWYLRAGRPEARHVGNAADPSEIAPLVAGSRGPGIDPDRPLLRETPEERAAAIGGRSREPKRQEWWVYAAVIGAVALGAGIVLANDLGDDQQRIEITLP